MKTNQLIVGSFVCAAFIHSSRLRADVVTDWNETADAVIRASTPSVPLQLRALAIVHTAVYEAVNGIARKYEPYFVTDAPPPGARQEAAAAQAAYTALKGLFPAQSALLDQKLAESIAHIPGHQGKSQSIARGLVWGEHVAQVVLVWRAADGLSTPTPPYLGGTAPGQWRSIPNGGTPGVLPQFASVEPFTLSSPSQFRPGPPPALTSPQYATDLNEVKAIGRTNSATRTADQTQAAQLWAAVGPLEENAVVRAVVPGWYELVDTARVFALVNFAACDAAIAGFDTKYHYGFWRPFHAIRLADTDGNPATDPDPTWTSLIAVPNHPEYISTHSIITGSVMGVLELLLGDETPFTLSAVGLPGVTRQFNRFSDAAAEVGPARVWGGLHFRNSCEVGAAMGALIAGQAVENYLLPR